MEQELQYRIIPEFIFELDWVSAQDAVIFGMIVGLSGKSGFCWASNDYIAKKTKCSGGTVKRSIKRFLDSELLTIEIDHAGGNTRKIYPNFKTPPRIKMIHPSDQNDPRSDQIDPPPSDQNDPLILKNNNIKSNIKNNNIPDSQESVKSNPKKTLYDIHTSITEDEYLILLRDPELVGGDREFLKQCCLEMEDWSKSNLNKKVDWLATLRNWVRRAKKNNKSYSKKSQAQKNVDFVKEFEQRELLKQKVG